MRLPPARSDPLPLSSVDLFALQLQQRLFFNQSAYFAGITACMEDARAARSCSATSCAYVLEWHSRAQLHGPMHSAFAAGLYSGLQ